MTRESHTRISWIVRAADSLLPPISPALKNGSSLESANNPLQFLFKPLTSPFPNELPDRHPGFNAAMDTLVCEFQPDHQFRLVEQFLAARFTDRYVTGFGDKSLREKTLMGSWKRSGSLRNFQSSYLTERQDHDGVFCAVEFSQLEFLQSVDGGPIFRLGPAVRPCSNRSRCSRQIPAIEHSAISRQ